MTQMLLNLPSSLDTGRLSRFELHLREGRRVVSQLFVVDLMPIIVELQGTVQVDRKSRMPGESHGETRGC